MGSVSSVSVFKRLCFSDPRNDLSFLFDDRVRRAFPTLRSFPLQLCNTNGKTPKDSWEEGRFEGARVELRLDQPFDTTNQLCIEQFLGGRISVVDIPISFLKSYPPAGVGDSTLVIAGSNAGNVARIVSYADESCVLEPIRGTSEYGQGNFVERTGNLVVIKSKNVK